jgi:magnesium transporter
MSLSDTRMNLIMKKLTSWAAIIAVPTAITGYYGQNIPYPGFGHEWGFALSTAAIVLIAVALYVTFKKKDWL